MGQKLQLNTLIKGLEIVGDCLKESNENVTGGWRKDNLYYVMVEFL